MRSLIVGLLLVVPLPLGAAVNGRIVRIEAPTSERMALHEVEVYVGEMNVARGKPGPTFAGTGYKGADINDRNGSKQLVDGKADLTDRGVQMGVTEGVGPWVELDFGKNLAIDRVILRHGNKPGFADRGQRLVTILDANRQVVFARQYDVRDPLVVNGAVTLAFAGEKHSLVGRKVPEKAAGWVSLAEFLDAKPFPSGPTTAQRTEAFRNRDQPASLNKLAREFFARLDLTRPGLATVKAAWERGDAATALDLYRDHFFARLAQIDFLPEHERLSRRYATEAQDLLAGVVVTLAVEEARGQRYEPGTIPWAFAPDESKATLTVARDRVLIGNLPRALLTAYRETGRVEYLRRWAEILDDWGLNLRDDLARSSVDCRDYFVKEPIQEFNWFCLELAETARKRPEFVRSLSGATLARFLIPVLEEYPPAYWWPCRRTAFNHTYNALNAAYTTARVLEDFHAGQRLGLENRQHWERVWTMNMTRDGTMIEIGDEGHLDMQLRMGVFYRQMQKDRPAWFTPAFQATFEDGYRQSCRYLIRHMTPNGLGHRFEIGDHFPRLWALSSTDCAIGGMVPRPRIDVRDVLREPEAQGIIQAVYGSARGNDKLSPARREAFDAVTRFYGKGEPSPGPASDWMPYAGLHYLRRGWKPDDAFVHFLGQPPGSAETNAHDWNTEFRFWDHGHPLLDCGPIRIDDQPQYPDAGRLTLAPGSKTERLSTASEFPIDGRFLTSARFDFAETFYRGTYQEHSVNLKENRIATRGKPLENVETQRQLIQVRPGRLWIATDIVQVPAGGEHTFDVPYRLLTPGSGDRKMPQYSGKVTTEDRKLISANGEVAGVSVLHFGPGKIAYIGGKGPNWWGETENTRADFLPPAYGASVKVARVRAGGSLLLVSLIESHRKDGDSILKSAEDLSAAGRAGFQATLADGSLLGWQTTSGAATSLQVFGVQVEAAGLLVWKGPQETTGIVLGGRGDKAGDFEFVMKDGKIVVTEPIRRPISPVTFGNSPTVFTETTTVTLHSATPGVEIRYTLDATEPTAKSLLYTAPLRLEQTTFVRARAFRPGVKEVPFAANGLDVTPISAATFTRRALVPASPLPSSSQPGLTTTPVQAGWFALFSHLHLAEVLPGGPARSGTGLLDVSLRTGDGPFGLRQTGYITVPADGVYTFHAPAEYVGATCEPGYDLRVFIDGEEWDLGQNWHRRGQWSVPLRKGSHRLMVTFADARHRDGTVHQPGLWRGYPSPWVVWKGTVPSLEVSGPDLARQPLPAQWLRCEK